MPVMRREDSPRFLAFLQFIYDHDGHYQRKRPDFAADLGIGTNVLRVLVERAVDLGIIRIIRTGSPRIGEPPMPNTYVLKMSPDEWLERKAEIVAAKAPKVTKRNQALAKRRRAAKERLLNVLVADPFAENVMMDPAEIVPTFMPPDPDVVPVVEDLDVDAWAD